VMNKRGNTREYQMEQKSTTSYSMDVEVSELLETSAQFFCPCSGSMR
jgi:hypothetical protein